MLLDRTVPLAAAWNTWSARPAELVFLPLGLKITPVLFSDKDGTATTIRAPGEIRFGRHDIRGRDIEFETDHAGTRLGFGYHKADPFAVRGGWRVIESGEWGLRYWVTLCLHAATGEEARFEKRDGAALLAVGSRVLALVFDEAPALVTAHESVDALAADFAANGYFDKSSRGSRGRVLALRFNLEMTPRLRFAGAIADAPDLALGTARQTLGAPVREAPPLQEGRHAGALDALRDVLGWNTVYDETHARPYVAASRIWGLGDAVWFNDQCFAGLMGGVLDSGVGRENFAAALSGATPQGNVACLVNPKDAWVDRAQAPHGAFAVWTAYLRGLDRSLLELAFEPLARNHRWWRANRDPDRRGLVSPGTSAVGDAMYEGTAFGARNETGMDNSATHDEAVYDPETRTLSTLDVGLNSALALDAEMLGAMARELGRAAEAEVFEALAARTRALVHAELWDEERGLFANRRRTGGGFVRSVSPTSFFPLLCGAADEGQVARLLAHLDDPAMFAGPFVLPNAARSEPAYRDNTYWRGRIWPNVNYLVWQGLRRYGLQRRADALAEASFALFMRSWRGRRLCGENYGAETGEIGDAPGNDPFYSWGALLPLMAVAQVMDVGPWNGWELRNAGEDTRLGPLVSPAGAARVAVTGGVLSLHVGDDLLFSTDRLGRLTEIVAERGIVSMTLAGEAAPAGASVRLGPGPSGRLAAVRLGGRPVETALEDGCHVVGLGAAKAGDRLDFHLSPARRGPRVTPGGRRASAGGPP